MFVQTLTIVAPVFLLIGFGYGLARTKILSMKVSEALGEFVYVVAIPILIFRTLVTADLSAGLPWALWASYFLGIACAWTLGTLVIRKGFGRDARAGAIGAISAAFANTILVGLPLVAAVYGDDGLIPLLLIVSIHLAFMTVLMAIVMERAAAHDSGGESPPVLTLIKSAAKSLIRNPLVITIIAAFCWRMTGFDLPSLASDLLNRIGATALPLALISLGMSLVQYGMRGNILPGLVLSAIKIVIMPATVFSLGYFVFNLPPLWVAVSTLTAACPTGINAYVFANKYGTGHAMSANAITVTTALAVLTTSLWIWFLEYVLGM
ncbi:MULTISPECIES: AEC family transporter [Stappiaceae]|uniref:AEC family transporter n=1 Tax=Stappiaceae TaxID=2821832 RepID=UPI001AD9A7E5|nr:MULTISPECIES: AEC family transporter [Stappiaceae]MBO9421532.1 AEC family transporter [Labrenzia sp. R4_2]